MFIVLEGFGFGKYFTDCIRLLYDKPRARVSTNGTVSDAFAIGCGTRQGCPLSPLIFALILEPLAQKIREDNAIKGILFGNNILYIKCLYKPMSFIFNPPRYINPVFTNRERRIGAP